MGPPPPPPGSAASLRARIEWVLQLEPSRTFSGFSPGSTYAEETSEFVYISDMLHHRVELEDKAIKRQPAALGDYVTCNVYYPAQASELASSEGLPVVIWLHPYSYATGYTPAYGQTAVWASLAKAGFAVIVYDQVRSFVDLAFVSDEIERRCCLSLSHIPMLTTYVFMHIR